MTKAVFSPLSEDMATTRLRVSEGRALLAIASQMKKGRHWLGPCRVLMDCGYIPRSRYDLFCDLVFSVLPDHEHLPHEDELRRMAVDCFSKPFKTWSDERAPVHGHHYLGYYDAGVAMLQQLPENSQKLPLSDGLFPPLFFCLYFCPQKVGRLF